MKIIMYHYIREKTKDLPFLRYLSFKNFCKQLDFLKKILVLLNMKILSI